MKRILAMILILGILLCGCSGNGNTDSGKTGDVQESTENAGEPTAAAGTEDEAGFVLKESDELNIIDDKYRNFYEIFVYSFYDSNNDGIGDLNGVTAKLDYIKEMGFNGIWFMPIHPSPTYHKYDVTDYYDIDPVYGTLDDFKNLLDEAHARGIDIIIDLVVNHSSSDHQWFKTAIDSIRNCKSPTGQYSDFYNFTTKADQAGYHKISGTDYWYEGRFVSGMPDINLDSENVRNEFANIIRYWLEMGVDGFRLDAVTSYYTGDVAKNIEFLKWVSDTAKAVKPDCFIVGEAWEGTYGQVREYFDSTVDSFFSFPTATGNGDIYNVMKEIRTNPGFVYSELLTNLQDVYDIGVPSMFLGNHDTARAASFMIKSQTDRVKMAAGLVSMMRGAWFTYYGEEIGMIGSLNDPEKRIAMKWSDKSVYEGWCYTPPTGAKVTADSYYYPSVEAQLEDESSILNYYKKALKLRNQNPEIARGEVSTYTEGISQYVSVSKRTYNGSSVIVVINLNRVESETVMLNRSELGYETVTGQLLTDTAQKVEFIEGEQDTLVLPPYSIVILR